MNKIQEILGTEENLQMKTYNEMCELLGCESIFYSDQLYSILHSESKLLFDAGLSEVMVESDGDLIISYDAVANVVRNLSAPLGLALMTQFIGKGADLLDEYSAKQVSFAKLVLEKLYKVCKHHGDISFLASTMVDLIDVAYVAGCDPESNHIMKGLKEKWEHICNSKVMCAGGTNEDDLFAGED